MAGEKSGKDHYVVQGDRWILHGEEGQDAGLKNKIKECTSHGTAAPNFTEGPECINPKDPTITIKTAKCPRKSSDQATSRTKKTKAPSDQKERETTPQRTTTPLPRNTPQGTANPDDGPIQTVRGKPSKEDPAIAILQSINSLCIRHQKQFADLVQAMDRKNNQETDRIIGDFNNTRLVKKWTLCGSG